MSSRNQSEEKDLKMAETKRILIRIVICISQASLHINHFSLIYKLNRHRARGSCPSLINKSHEHRQQSARQNSLFFINWTCYTGSTSGKHTLGSYVTSVTFIFMNLLYRSFCWQHQILFRCVLDSSLIISMNKFLNLLPDMNCVKFNAAIITTLHYLSSDYSAK